MQSRTSQARVEGSLVNVRNDPGGSARRRLRLAGWVLLLSGLGGGLAMWMWLVRGPRILEHDAALVGGWMLLGAAVSGLAILLKTTPEDAIKLRGSTSRWIIMGTTAALQAAGLLLLIPGLSEDLIRYRLDGRMWLAGISPYAMTPRDFLASHEHDSIDEAIPFGWMKTIYPPASQGLFIVAAAIEKHLAPPPAASGSWREILKHQPAANGGLVLRVLFAAAAIGAVGLLLKLLSIAGESPWWVVLFAWNPLVLMETAGMGHQDIAAVVLLLGMLWMARIKKFGTAAVCLALACGIELPALVMLPFLYRDAHEHGTWRAGRRMLLIFAGCAMALYLPMLLYEQGYQGWLQAGRIFTRQWEANGSIYELCKWAFGAGDDGSAMQRANDAGRLIGIVVLLLGGLMLWQMRATLAEAGYWMFLLMLLVSPVAYPWHLMWVLCFVPLVRGPQGLAGLAWGATIPMSYLLWRQGQWVMPGRWLLAEYAPVYAVLAGEVGILLSRPALARAAVIAPADSEL